MRQCGPKTYFFGCEQEGGLKKNGFQDQFYVLRYRFGVIESIPTVKTAHQFFCRLENDTFDQFYGGAWLFLATAV